jgi:hypothetical protein
VVLRKCFRLSRNSLKGVNRAPTNSSDEDPYLYKSCGLS